MKPFIKWPGGKTEELKIILENLAENINRFYEPFVGGGAVYFAVDNIKQYYINDKSNELINLYKSIQSKNNIFFSAIKEIDKCWKILEKISEDYIYKLSDLYNEYKLNRISDAQLKINIERF
ncbi:DNA adenine methylase, partial [Mesomycoplasma ovipneumoniae]|uniref:DNA adenine methylase n=1 Tax=Mesomycoplasma ovipneumoniae TaxID=29562 RepID=UPI002965702F